MKFTKTRVRVLSDITDEALMAAFTETREEKYFSELYKRYFLSICKYISWYSGNRDMGQDIAQNTFINIFNNPLLFDPTRNFKIWLFSIAKNNWKNEQRQLVVKYKYLEKFEQLENSRNTAFEEREDNYKNEIARSIATLSESHREVMILKYSNNLTIDEISTILKCSPGTVKSRLFYALKKLRTQLNPSEKL